MFDVNYDFFLIENNFKEIEGVKSEKIQGDISSKLPLVSIVIPTYKRVSTLRETLDSVIRQTGNHNYEILVVDNNPERGDETELMMAEYVSVKNLLYFKNTENIGMAGNWSRCSELANGEWVVLIHDDDLLVIFLTILKIYTLIFYNQYIIRKVILMEKQIRNKNRN